MLSKIRDDFKSNFQWEYSISIGKIDNNQERTICFYPSKRDSGYQNTVGGKKNRSYKLKKVTILLRYTKNQVSAEDMAQEIYDFFEERSFFIDEERVFVVMKCENPIWLGTDDKGVYEYSFELDFIKKGR